MSMLIMLIMRAAKWRAMATESHLTQISLRTLITLITPVDIIRVRDRRVGVRESDPGWRGRDVGEERVYQRYI